MADLMQFDLVSPEKRLASLEASMAQIPGGDGDFTAMSNHAPMVTTLRAGILRVVAGNGEVSEYVVSGGFVEIGEAGTTVLAERAALKAEASSGFFDEAIRAAEEAVGLAGDDAVAKAQAELALNDVKFAQSQLS